MGHPPATQMKNYRQLKAMRKEELAFSRDEHPKELLNPKWYHRQTNNNNKTIHVAENELTRLHFIYAYGYVYLHMLK